MKNALFGIAIAAAGSYLYLHRAQPPATTLPEGHHHVPDGVYYLRTAYTVPAPGEPVQWASGQALFEDRRTGQTADANGTISVTDGTHTARLLTSMLSQDVEEGTTLRTADLAAADRVAQDRLAQDRLAQDRLAQDRLAQDRVRAEALARSPLQQQATPTRTYHSPLEESSRPLGAVYYGSGYGTVMVREQRSSAFQSTQRTQPVEHARPVKIQTTYPPATSTH